VSRGGPLWPYPVAAAVFAVPSLCLWPLASISALLLLAWVVLLISRSGDYPLCNRCGRQTINPDDYEMTGKPKSYALPFCFYPAVALSYLAVVSLLTWAALQAIS
jgi:hypothetical protein